MNPATNNCHVEEQRDDLKHIETIFYRISRLSDDSVWANQDTDELFICRP